MPQVIPTPTDVMAPRYPFAAETVAEHRKSKVSASKEDDLPFRLRRQIRTLAFLTPFQVLILALVLMAALQSSGLFIFRKGFLLTRQSLSEKNLCEPVNSDGIVDPSCSMPPTHSKMILLIVDALRADFILPVSPQSTQFSPFYHNHLSLPSDLSARQPGHSFITHFIADAPTTTLQRLKALTTGSLPTFIDAGSNFGGEAITEDTWLSQAKRSGKRIAFVGDDTWLNVFPHGKNTTTKPNDSVWLDDNVHPFDSFNVEDLDTVDQGVREHLLSYLTPNKESTKNSAWDIIIAHSLGLDHAGHRFGAKHAETTRKLRETQQLLEKIVELLDDDTLLLVMGDHGVTDHGDHGGDSREEIDAALWVYSKGVELTDSQWLVTPSSSNNHPLSHLEENPSDSRDLGDQLRLEWAEKGLRTSTRSVSQIDIVPTISLLLGLPIPFGNLGLVIPELFYHTSLLPVAPKPDDKLSKSLHKPKKTFFGIGGSSNIPQRQMETLTPLQTLLHATLLTSSQLEQHLSAYISSPNGADLRPAMPHLHYILAIAKSAYRGAHAPGQSKIDMELRALSKFSTYQRTAREKARSVWARFDMKLIAAGLSVWLGSLLVSLRFLSASKRGPTSRWIAGKGLEGLLVVSIGILAAWLMSFFDLFGGLEPIWLLCLLSASIELIILVTPTMNSTAKEALGITSLGRLQNPLHALPLILHCAVFASNSFLVFEDTAVLYILSSGICFICVNAISAPEKRLRDRIIGLGLVILVCLRIMAFNTICREEQAPHCLATINTGPNGPMWVISLAMAAAWLAPTIILKFLAISASDAGIASALLNIAIRGLLLMATAYWAVEKAISSNSDAEKVALLTIVKTGLARVVMVATAMTGSLIWYNCPLCLKIQREVTKRDGLPDQTRVKFIGFANTFGSFYILFVSTVYVLIFLVNPPPAQIIVLLQLIITLSLLEIFDSQRDVEVLKSVRSIEALLNNESLSVPAHTGPTFVEVSLIALLSHLSFFSTGHQATFSSIQWSTAFIGFPTIRYPFSPILVILNTLGPHIIGALSIPLFVFWNLAPTLKDQLPLPLPRSLLKASTSYFLYQGTLSLSTAFWASYFRRHLMVWKVFAPRFMLGGITLIAVQVTLIVFGIAWGATVTVSKVRSTLGTRMTD